MTTSLLLASPATAQFADDFESGNTLAWGASVPPLPQPDAFRYSDLDLRDPHVFVDVPVLGCFDFTDDELPLGLGPSFNELLETSITADDDGDGLLDLSLILGFRPLERLAIGERVDQGSGLCTAPLATTACDWDLTTTPQTTSYDGLASGTCLEPAPGTTSGYTPAITEPAAPCFVTAPLSGTVSLGTVDITLVDGQTAATWVGDPPTNASDGLFLGFLSEADADAIVLPPEIPLVGGQPLSILLPGGAGNCAPGDDRDLHQGVPGWWFYFNHTAAEVPFVGR